MDFNLDSSDEPVINFNMNNATYETPLTKVIKLNRVIPPNTKNPQISNGEVIPKVAMFTAEEAPVSLILKDIETESDVQFLYNLMREN